VLVWKTIAWGELFANAYFLAFLVALLLILAASTFGAFSVGMPNWLYQISPRHDTYAGNFLFGILTAVLSTPCTFGMFLGLMIWAVRQPATLGMSLMITVGAGMAFPYLLLSAFPSLARKLPRSGPWAELVKQMMGFLLVASAVYFARRFIVQALNDKIFWWALFAVVLIAGIYLVVRAMQFAKSKTSPLVACVIAILFVAPSLLFTWRLTHPPIDWKPYSEQALASARQSGKPVMVEFTAAWCGNCVALETSVFHERRLVEAIKQLQVTTLRADLTREDAPGWKLLGTISPIKAVPLTAVYGAQGDEPKKLSGIYSTDDLVTALREAASRKLSSARE
jgi:thiol:disulfide interchange protein DsbD